MSREKSIQEAFITKLEKLNLIPFSVICTFADKTGGLLALTFYLNSDLLKFLDVIDYPSLCDKSGYTLFKKNNTIIISGMALINLYVKI